MRDDVVIIDVADRHGAELLVIGLGEDRIAHSRLPKGGDSGDLASESRRGEHGDGSAKAVAGEVVAAAGKILEGLLRLRLQRPERPAEAAMDLPGEATQYDLSIIDVRS